MKIKCKTKDKLPLEALADFQGNLKRRTEGDYKKIITSIEKYGFSFPFFVWSHDGTNHVLDGHGRLGALQRMRAAGAQIPDLPVVYVDCPDEEAAKNLLLRLNSQYGTMTTESVMDFMAGLEIAAEELALPDGVLDLTAQQQEEIDRTKKTLREQFIVPPFSVLDSRIDYWQERKRQWKSIGIRSDEGRKVGKIHQNVLAFVKGDLDEAAKIHQNVLVFLKGESGKEATRELGPVVVDNIDLPEPEDD